MAEDTVDKSALIPVDFDSLAPQEQLERLLTTSSNYLASVEARTTRSNLWGVAADIAWYQAFGELSVMTQSVRSKLVDETLMGTGMVTDENISAAIAENFEGIRQYLSSLQFAAKFSPSAGPIEYLSQLGESLEDRQLELAIKVAEAVIQRFPGFYKLAQTSHSDVFNLIKRYFRANLRGGQPPEYLSYVTYFLKDYWAWKNWQGRDEEMERRNFNNMHLKRHQMMDYVFSEALSGREQKTISKIVEYGNSLNLTKYSRFKF